MWAIFLIIFILLILALAWFAFAGRGDCCEEKPACKPLINVGSPYDDCGSWTGAGIIFFIFLIILIGLFCWRGMHSESAPLF